MATMQIVESLMYARNAGADLSTKLHYLAKIDTDGDIVLAGDGEQVFGTIYEAATENNPVTLQFGGLGKCILAATVAAGAKMASDSDGKGVTATTGEYAFGICLEGGDAGNIATFAFIPGGRVA